MNFFKRRQDTFDFAPVPPSIPESPALKTGQLLELLAFLIEDAESFYQSEAVVSFREQKIIYTFENTEGSRAEGSIHYSLEKPLREFFQLALHSLGFRIMLPSRTESRILRIEKPGDPLSFRMSWQEEAAARESRRLSVVPELPDAAPVQEPRRNSKKGRKSSRGRSVLVVEDNSAFAQVLSRFLDRHEIPATFAGNALEAIEILSREHIKPALIVCDIHMPGMNGLEFLEQLRADSQLLDIPLIMLTADDSVETKIRAIAAGAEASLTKSEDPRLLYAHVTRILTRGRKREAA